MKVLMAFLFVFVLSTEANTYSQVISLDLDKATYKEVFSEIEKKSGYIFIFRDNVKRDILKNTSVTVSSDSIEEIMNLVVENTEMRYRIFDKQIVVYKEEEEVTKEDTVDHKPGEVMQNNIPVSGRVTDQYGEPVIGATIRLKGSTSIGTATDLDGNFNLPNVPVNGILIVSFIGLETVEYQIQDRNYLEIVMSTGSTTLEDVVVVGYASQKKETLVGAVAKVEGEVLEARGGVTNLSSALQGQIPGVMVIEGSGEPGRDDPEILIRGMSTWNNAQPLILVDGVERRMNDIRIKDVESISVLKDASATSVFGVKGANGVILITTKRGTLGKPTLTVSASTAIKTISKLDLIMDSYAARQFKNEGIEREVAINTNTWHLYTPVEELEFFKKPQVDPYTYLFPNIDWVDLITRDFQASSSVGLDLRGGTEFVKYFVSVGYLNDGDILNSTYQEDRGYTPGFGYNRFNFRNNLDFTLTKSTKLSVDINGYVGKQKGNYSDGGTAPIVGSSGPKYNSYQIVGTLYSIAPDAMYSKYPDGWYGRGKDGQGGNNPLSLLDRGGLRYTNRNHFGADVKLEQKLDIITPGLSANLHISWDGFAASNGPGISENSNSGVASYQYISPEILQAKTREDSIRHIQRWNSLLNAAGINEFDYVLRPWMPVSESVTASYLQRSLFYQASLNYDRNFGRHAVTALALFNRREDATGSVFASYREDWVGRITYNYDLRYMTEVNAAYNGSEKFSPKYRFGFFPSAALGWMVSNEDFMKDITWIDHLKIRGTIGKIGSDAGIPRWSYISSWTSGSGNTQAMTFLGANQKGNIWSPYASYFEGTIANPDIRWETAIKRNIGLDFAALRNSVTLEMDFFNEHRKDIFVSSSQRNIPDYFGASPVAANLGETFTKGYEITVGYKKVNYSGVGYSVQLSTTHAVDKILKMEDPLMMESYMKKEGYQIGQNTAQLSAGYMNNWDDVYASTPANSNQGERLPGDWDAVDYNGDGKDTWDVVPWGYPQRPQDTYSATFGFNYKKLSLLFQFYGVHKSTLSLFVQQPEPTLHTAISSFLSDYWTPENRDAKFRAPRVGTKGGAGTFEYSRFNGSYLRLKTAEIAYLFDEPWIKNIGVSAIRIYINGNNLLYWSHTPYDTEKSFNNAEGYPKTKQINMGLDISF